VDEPPQHRRADLRADAKCDDLRKVALYRNVGRTSDAERPQRRGAEEAEDLLVAQGVVRRAT
jgi:hypothetical protein